ncbi:hypothetical protein N9B82_03965 [Saprospiraceae bacterium]|nr:hypothetical protein [Saprospiraceae bacterium]
MDDISDIPRIDLVSLSSNTITEFDETLVITISYEDGDGNLGFEETDQYALLVRDIRLDEFDGFYVGPIAPPEVVIPIKGEFDIEFPSLFIFGNGEIETTKFEIKMVDRAMNESNLLITEDVIISR